MRIQIAAALLIATSLIPGLGFADSAKPLKRPFASGISKVPVKPVPLHVPLASLASTCDLSEIEARSLVIEGADINDPNRIFLNLNHKFEPGPDDVVNGKKRSTIVIRETMEIGFFRNWLVEGVTGLAAQVRESVPDSCSNSRGSTSGAVLGYTPATFEIKQLMTKRQCTSFDQPCGAPEITCTGGSAGTLPSCSLPSCNLSGCRGGGCSGGSPPELPTCVTKVKTCRVEQKVDVFGAEIAMVYDLPLGVTGSPPSQRIEIQPRVLRSDIDSSQGELTKLLNDIGLAEILGGKVSSFTDGMRNFLNSSTGTLTSGPQYFAIPTSDYVYLPIVRRNGDVNWVSPGSVPSGAAPFGLRIVRDMSLPTSLACRVGECLRKSKSSGQLLVKSCSI